MLPKSEDLNPGIYRMEKCLRLSSYGVWSEAFCLIDIVSGKVVSPVLSSKERLADWMSGAGKKR